MVKGYSLLLWFFTYLGNAQYYAISELLFGIPECEKGGR